jgi:hypothetical protein
MYSTLFQDVDDKHFRDTTIVFDNPLLALRSQLQHMHNSEKPLPLVATYNVTTTASKNKKTRPLISYSVWDTQPSRKYVFWSPQFSAKVVNMAVRLGSHVLFREQNKDYRRMMPHAWLRYVLTNAYSWRIGLERGLQVMSHNRLTSTLAALEVPDDLFRGFVNHCPKDLQNSIEKCSAKARQMRVALIGEREVVENSEGWFFKATFRRISEAAVRIDRIIRYRDTGYAFYQGVIKYQGQDIPFTEQAMKMDKAGFRLISQIIERECQRVLACNMHYSKKMVDLAKQFHQPEVVMSPSRFGWDPESASFVLPNFTLRPGGQIETGLTPFRDPEAPGLQLQPPDAIPFALDKLSDDNDAMRVFWATTACVAANVLAPALNRPTVGTGLVGTGAAIVGKQTALALGCSEVRIEGRVAHQNASELVAESQKHRWPIYANLKARSRALITWYGMPEDKNVILPVRDTLMDPVGLISPWRFVMQADTQAITRAEVSSAYEIMPYWLKSISERQLQLESDADVYVFQVLQDLAAWVGRNGGNAELVRASSALINDLGDMPWELANRFGAFLYKCIAKGMLSIADADFPEKQERQQMLYRIVEDQRPYMYISRRALQYLLTKHGFPGMNPSQITEALTAAGAFDREVVYNDEVGWLFIEDWWKDQLKQHRAAEHKTLRVVG